jgi:hypothetical protein
MPSSISSFNKQARIDTNTLAEALKPFISDEAHPRFFFTMTNINKVGLNPRSSFNTPLGVYAYPLTKEMFDSIISNTLPFAGEKPFINVFSISAPLFNLSEYTDGDLNKDLPKIKSLFPALTDDQIQEAFNSANDPSSAISKFWNLTRIVSGGMRGWNHLLRKLGRTNVYDPGQSVIHSNEPTQIVILDPTIIQINDTFYNPHTNMHDPSVNKNLLSPTDTKMLLQKDKGKYELSYRIPKITDPEHLDRIATKYANNPIIAFLLLENKHLPDNAFTMLLSNKNNFDNFFYDTAFPDRISHNILERFANYIIDHNPKWMAEGIYMGTKFDIYYQKLIELGDNEILRLLAGNRTIPEHILVNVLTKIKEYINDGGSPAEIEGILYSITRNSAGNAHLRQMIMQIVEKENLFPIEFVYRIKFLLHKEKLAFAAKKSKLALDEIKKIPPSSLLRLINQAKKTLIKDKVWKRICKEWKVSPEIINLIPTKFGDIDTSAKTDHGVVILSWQLLLSGDFSENYSYLLHEFSHFFQQGFSDEPTQSSNEGSYLHNTSEQEAFSNQVEYLSLHKGKDEAENYVDHLLDHHEIKKPKEKAELKEILLEKA